MATVSKPPASRDVSPKTIPIPSHPKTTYHETAGSTSSARTNDSIDSLSDRKSSTTSDTAPLAAVARGPMTLTTSNNTSSKDDDGLSPTTATTTPTDGLRRHSSVSIQLPNTALPQGTQKGITKGRLRNASPDHHRFQNRVAFDNLPLGEATKYNTPSFTLNVKHKGYRAGRRSRTFMVGVDENTYSDYALQWLLDELVDDGDEVVCVRVLEKDVRVGQKVYQDEAQAIMKSVLERNTANHALSFVLEYAGGKLHGTFQKLIHMYQPAMLVVGTRGRSLGGLHGLVNTRNSFSKYCLQYSPVPVVVVRPTEKRNKKKERRAADSTRKTYARMLAATNGKHEADSDTASTYDLEVQISADEEAHQVAKVLGLPASFDPTIKPLAQATATKRLSATSSPQVSTTNLVPPTSTPAAAEAAASTDASSAAPGDTDKVSGDDDKRQVAEGTATTVVVDEAKMPEIGSGNSESSDGDDDDEDDGGDEGEFEVMSGQEALDQQKLEQLHKMEVGEAAALRMKVDSDDDEDDEDKS